MIIWLVLRALLVALLTVCAAIVLRYLLLRRGMLRAGRSPPQLPSGFATSEVENFIRRRDEQAAPLQPDAGSAVLWFDGQRDTRADVVVLFLHGWSASVQEISPVDVNIARGLRAHLLRYRLTGHGVAPHERGGDMMRDEATCHALLNDAGVAFQLAALLGKRVVLVGCSTGAVLSAWLAVQPWAAPLVTNLLLLSPCFSLLRPSRQIYRSLRWPFLLLPRALVVPALHKVTGRVNRIPYKSVAQAHCSFLTPCSSLLAPYSLLLTPCSYAWSLLVTSYSLLRAAQAHCWTLVYPTEASLNAIGVFVTAEVALDPAQLRVPVFVWACPEDPTADYTITEEWCRSVPVCSLEAVTPGTEQKHNITGGIQNPSTVERISTRAVELSRAVLGEGARG